MELTKTWCECAPLALYILAVHLTLGFSFLPNTPQVAYANATLPTAEEPEDK